jgi:hypothetical protein
MMITDKLPALIAQQLEVLAVLGKVVYPVVSNRATTIAQGLLLWRIL